MNYKENKKLCLELKYASNQIGGKIKKCSIDDTDKILFGDGGSTAIIVITKDKKFIKYLLYIILF